jgi:chromosome segregation ATPase
MSTGTGGSREKIQVFKLGKEFLGAAKTVTPTIYGATPDLLSNITSLRDIMATPDSPPTVPQITSTLSACFVHLFQYLNSTQQTLLATHQELGTTTDELAAAKAANEALNQQIGQYSLDHLPHTPLTQSTNLQSEIEALKKQNAEDQARLTLLSQENKKLRTQKSELKEKVESFRKHIRLSEESRSTPANNNGSIEPPDVPMDDSTTLSQKQDMEIRLLEYEQKYLIQSLEDEKKMRLGVELELADLQVEYELQEKMMIDWFLEAVRVTDGEEYLKQLKTLKEIRPMPPSKS